MQLQMSFMFSTLENETRHINIGSQFTLELMTIHFMTNVYPGKEDLIKWHRCVFYFFFLPFFVNFSKTMCFVLNRDTNFAWWIMISWSWTTLFWFTDQALKPLNPIKNIPINLKSLHKTILLRKSLSQNWNNCMAHEKDVKNDEKRQWK